MTQNNMAIMLGRDRGTIKRIIADHSIEGRKYGAWEYFKVADVVNAMVEGDRLDLQQERAKLAKRQTEKAEIQIAQMRGDLIDATEVEARWTRLVANCRAKLLAIPTKIAPDILSMDNLAQVQDAVKTVLYEAMRELARGD